MFLSLIRIVPVPGKRDELLEMLFSVKRNTRMLNGCLDCTVYMETEVADAVVFLSKWETSEALHRHVQSALYLRVLHSMDLASQPPEVSFYEVAGEKGMEFIQELREPELEIMKNGS